MKWFKETGKLELLRKEYRKLVIKYPPTMEAPKMLSKKSMPNMISFLKE